MTIRGYTDRFCPRCGTFTQQIILQPRAAWQCMNCDTRSGKPSRRYVVRRLTNTELRGPDSSPWLVLDTQTNRIEDEYASRAAAQMDASARNAEVAAATAAAAAKAREAPEEREAPRTLDLSTWTAAERSRLMDFVRILLEWQRERER